MRRGLRSREVTAFDPGVTNGVTRETGIPGFFICLTEMRVEGGAADTPT